jgi:nicotinate-nucleotide adenylyltransferase
MSTKFTKSDSRFVDAKPGQRIGIYSGTFNPVHAGHLAFALQAVKAAKLDRVYFLPERRPRHKTNVEHFGHRVAMLNRAVRPHPKLSVLELDDVSFTVQRTLLNLQKMFLSSQLVMLLGSDVVNNLPSWPQSDQLLNSCELVVGVRDEERLESLVENLSDWQTQPQRLTILPSYAADVSSGEVRKALTERRHARGLLASVAQYSNRNWLYVSLGAN